MSHFYVSSIKKKHFIANKNFTKPRLRNSAVARANKARGHKPKVGGGDKNGASFCTSKLIIILRVRIMRHLKILHSCLKKRDV